VLPRSIRPQIGLAYALARATDTVADTETLPVQRRLDALEALRDRILGRTHTPLDWSAFAPPHAEGRPAPRGGQSSAAERLLLHRVNALLVLLRQGFPRDQHHIRHVLDTITGGQLLDLQRFGQAGGDRPAALQSELDLEDYTYRVAGCVGEFWTRMCRTHVFPNARLDEEQLLFNGIRFGKGLQLINILRDLPADLKLGRCYLPMDSLKTVSLNPSDLSRSAVCGRTHNNGGSSQRLHERRDAARRTDTRIWRRCCRRVARPQP
jgi:farnesyl-diphosphate farnesyltransferase